MTSENDPPEGEMSHLDFLRAQFFSVALPFDSRQELDALAAFAQALEAMPRQARLAAINWLADKYLGKRVIR